MKHFIYLLGAGLMMGLFLSCSGKDAPFISDAGYRMQVERDFQQKQALMPEGDLFDIFHADLTDYEREALEFLYAYMPLADITDYSGDFHLMNVRAARRAVQEMSWGRTVPEALFRHFVLPVRVNNEPLDSARVVFYKELKPRVQGKSMYDAILEVNHWCHEKAVYQPTDARTSAPLATVRTAFGRCGEESTFLVAALRSIGIPARQVYTPRWAHTDDNHAWVEAWADGKWYFLGACEPEPVLNLGWFNDPAARGMLMHTKVFGRYEGPEDVMSRTPGYTEINVIDNYAPTARATVRVTDEAGNPVQGAQVEFKLYNYAEFYTVARKLTDAGGCASLTAGKGDVLAWASQGGRFGFAKLSFGKQDTLNLKLNHRDGDVFELDMDIVPPVETSDMPEVTAGQRAENDRRMMEEDSIRHAYEATFFTQEGAAAFVKTISGLNACYAGQAVSYLVASRGNHATLCRFLTMASAEGNAEEAVRLLGVLTEKDLRDVRFEVLADHWLHTPQAGCEQYASALLNPRVATEELTPYKSFFQTVINGDDAEVYRQNPHKLVEWCKENITLKDSLNAQRIPMTPIGVWKSRIADSYSRDIFFVSVARSMGIPAWIDNVTGRVCYQDLAGHADLKNGKTYEVDFDEGTAQEAPAVGRLAATFRPTKYFDDPKYYMHFTLSRCRDGVLQLQNYSESDTWKSLLSTPRPMPAGYYLMVSGTRLASGSVLAHLNAFNVQAGQTQTTALMMRESKDQIQVIGNFNSESLFTPVVDGAMADEPTSVLKACGRGYFVIGVLGVNQEPTNHALKDVAKLGKELEKWGRKLVLLFPDEEKFGLYRPQDFEGLPDTIIYGVDTNGIAEEIVSGMKLKSAQTLPLFIIADTFNRVVFVSQGYTIGLGEQLMRTVRGV